MSACDTLVVIGGLRAELNNVLLACLKICHEDVPIEGSTELRVILEGH